jgi:hypothetical protein
MLDELRLLLAVAAAYGCAFVVGPFLRMRGVVAIPAISIATPAVLLSPLLIPSERIRLRAVAAFVATDLMFRMIDYFCHQRSKRDTAGYRDYCRFLVPFPVLLVTLAEHRRRLLGNVLAWQDVVRVFGGAAGVAAGFLFLGLAEEVAIIRESFFVDHVVKVAIFVLTIESASRLLYGLERLAGCDTTPIVQNAFLSRTVAEFWQRYNSRVHRWLYDNIFLPSGGRRAATRGICLVFLVSALLHELMFGIATSRFDGYQFAFFMLQAPAVLASRPIERWTKHGGIVAKAAAHSSAILWMVGSSVLFFHSVNNVFPFFYASESWLP